MEEFSQRRPTTATIHGKVLRYKVCHMHSSKRGCKNEPQLITKMCFLLKASSNQHPVRFLRFPRWFNSCTGTADGCGFQHWQGICTGTRRNAEYPDWAAGANLAEELVRGWEPIDGARLCVRLFPNNTTTRTPRTLPGIKIRGDDGN